MIKKIIIMKKRKKKRKKRGKIKIMRKITIIMMKIMIIKKLNL